MPLQLELLAPSTVPIEVEGLLPETVCDKSPAEIEQWPVFHGNQKLPLAELFSVRGSAADLCFEFAGDCAGVHWIGAGMQAGTIRVAGDAGRHLGSEMRGGEIHVAGSAGDWVGGEMHGGLIHVRGRAGHLIGAAYRGSRRGMTGGILLVEGDVGNEIGHTMRRGLIVVGGSAGDFPAISMIAGTVLILGSCGLRPAAGMRRGTLGVFGEPPAMLPTFRQGGRGRPSFLPLYLRQLIKFGFPIPAELLVADYLTHYGDLLTVGRGEILTRN